jgi:cyclopropane-fatty-acyl-phospholipid synthase
MRIARAIVLGLLERTRGGVLVLVEGDRRLELGDAAAASALRATVTVRSPRIYRHLLRGSIGLAESYVERLWECDDLAALVRIAARNAGSFDRLRRWLLPIVVGPQRLARRLVRNTPARSRRQVAAHYDLGNDLFELMLDETMLYSCALFSAPQMTLADAQQAKLDRVCQKLGLSSDHHVLEIGTGWGAFAIHAASRYGCRVTTTTISAEQHRYVQARVRAAGLADRVEVLLKDYRELEGSYDRLVSIEMIEAVGWQYFGRFFARCSDLLRPDGAMLLQAITIDDRAYDVQKGSRTFINTYIFPGGCLPSQAVIARSLARLTDLRMVHLEDITPHYVETLRRWRANFLARADTVAKLGYDERFRRLWELYLCYCEAGFSERRISDVQLLLAKPRFERLNVGAQAARRDAHAALGAATA